MTVPISDHSMHQKQWRKRNYRFNELIFIQTDREIKAPALVDRALDATACAIFIVDADRIVLALALNH